MRRMDEAPREGPRLSVFRVKVKNSPLVFWVLGRSCRGFPSHWDGRRTVPCNREEQGMHCQGCEEKWGERWRCYLDVVDEKTRDRGFLELTGVGKANLLSCVNGEENLRGSRIQVARGGGDKTRLRFTYLAPGNQREVATWPEELDPHDTVLALYLSELKKVRGPWCNTPPGRNGKHAEVEGGDE